MSSRSRDLAEDPELAHMLPRFARISLAHVLGMSGVSPATTARFEHAPTEWEAASAANAAIGEVLRYQGSLRDGRVYILDTVVGALTEFRRATETRRPSMYRDAIALADNAAYRFGGGVLGELRRKQGSLI